MEWTGLNELREKYLSFFEKKGHLRLDSFPLVPQGDNSLLLINSGMAPMKKWFLGQEEPPRHRVTTCQKCIRTPDIERVGKTARHGTFFEMLGNFSFGDYFKHEVTQWAWEFLTEELQIPRDLLYISVYEEDDEAYDIWVKEVGIDPSHMVRFGREDNFWEIGSGPCGPCSEIYFDRGEKYGCGKPTCAVGCDCDRFIEIWNLVFSQFDTDGNGHYEKMAHPNIDTGMGLERLAVVMQDVDNLFEVDTIQNIMRQVEKMAGVTYKQSEKTDVSIRVICDHIRSTVFMVGDGVIPSNEGRGYVLRRLLRRAARHGRMLGIEGSFLSTLCDTVIHENLTAYPYLNENREYIKRVIEEEEKRFAKTIDAGMNMLNSLFDAIETASATGKRVLSGIDAFKLNDTFGFPLDLTKEIAMENGIEVDEENFMKLLEEQRTRPREARSRMDNAGWVDDLFQGVQGEATVFTGYEGLVTEGKILALAHDNELADAVAVDEAEKDGVLVVLDKTSFYAQSGGQVGDMGRITGEGVVLRVNGCHKTPRGFYVHTCVLESGVVKTGDAVMATVNANTRAATARNHTAAHLLQEALRRVLGSHVHQAGSYVDPQRVRFDFNHFSAVTPEELQRVEDLVNDAIFDALNVQVTEMPLADAKAKGVTALFGEKYGEIVRVVDVNGFSAELCGGTHVDNTAKLGSFKILSESSVAAGIRRIEGTTGYGVLRLLDERTALLRQSAEALKVSNLNELPLRATAVSHDLKAKEKEIAELKAQIARSNVEKLLAEAKEVNGVKVYTAFFDNMGAEELRQMGYALRDKEPCAVAALCGSEGGKTTLAVACGKEANAKGILAGAVAKAAAAVAGGSGGGKPDFAMAGVKDPAKIQDMLAAVPGIVAEKTV